MNKKFVDRILDTNLQMAVRGLLGTKGETGQVSFETVVNAVMNYADEPHNAPAKGKPSTTTDDVDGGWTKQLAELQKQMAEMTASMPSDGACVRALTVNNCLTAV